MKRRARARAAAMSPWKVVSTTSLIVGQRRLRHHQRVGPPMIEQKPAVILGQETSQVRVGRVGDPAHDITLAGGDVVDVEVPPGPFGRRRRSVDRSGQIEQIGRCHARIDVVEEVVEVVATQTDGTRRELVARIRNEQTGPPWLGTERLAGVDPSPLAVARPSVEVAHRLHLGRGEASRRRPRRRCTASSPDRAPGRSRSSAGRRSRHPRCRRCGRKPRERHQPADPSCERCRTVRRRQYRTPAPP